MKTTKSLKNRLFFTKTDSMTDYAVRTSVRYRREREAGSLVKAEGNPGEINRFFAILELFEAVFAMNCENSPESLP